MAALGLVISNIGALYRIRYLYWILLIILGMKGLESILASRRARRTVAPHIKPSGNQLRNNDRDQSVDQRRLGLMLSALLIACVVCSSCGGSAAKPEASAPLDFRLVNRTGSMIRAIYISPRDSTGWEENVLGEGKLLNGDSVTIRFRPEEHAAVWDLQVQFRYQSSSAEWKSLNLQEISKITLHIGEDRNLVMAEVE